MKVAICFSGAIRNFDDCIGSTLKYFINNFENPDIFLHMWTFNDSDTTKNITYNFKWRKDNSDTNEILSILNPKKYVIEEYTNQSEQLILSQSNIQVDKFDSEQKKNYGFNCCSMYWKILQSFKLAEEYSIENNFEYDLIIRARLDFIWEDHIIPSDFNNLTDDNIFLIKDRYATCSKLITNDKFFAGNYNTMKKMCDIFNYIKTYQDEDILIEGQTINELHIKKMNFKVNWIGNLKTYYKFMNRHKIIPNNIKILVNLNNFLNLKNIFSMLLNELVYKLIYCGYTVICSDDCIENYNSFNKRFIKNSTEYDFLISNNNNIITINKNNIIKKLNYSFNVLNSVLNNPNIFIDFIISLINNFNDTKSDEFNFKKISQINNIETNDVIIYRYLDHGYYKCNYIELENKNHLILFDKKNIKVTRDLFTIVNLVKYYKEGILPTN